MTSRPRIWLLKHRRAGDLRQMRHLTGLLGEGWEVEEKQLNFRLPALAYAPATALLAVDGSHSSSLFPPLPTAILAAEALSAKIAVALKSKGNFGPKIIVLGRPAGSLDAFDLVLTTRQYDLPSGPNVIELPVPLAAPPPVTAQERLRLLALMEAKPRPWIALLIGGSVAPDILDESSAELVTAAALKLTRDLGGSLIALSSPRTGGMLENHFRHKLSQAALLQLGRPAGEGNLYGAVIAEADRFLVTSDSVSMVTEAMTSEKPVTVFMLPQRFPAAARMVRTLARHENVLSHFYRAGILERPPDRAGYFRMLESRNALSIYPRQADRTKSYLLSESERIAREAVRRLFA